MTLFPMNASSADFRLKKPDTLDSSLPHSFNILAVSSTIIPQQPRLASHLVHPGKRTQCCCVARSAREPEYPEMYGICSYPRSTRSNQGPPMLRPIPFSTSGVNIKYASKRALGRRSFRAQPDIMLPPYS
ncbi:hypothetical protein PV05_06432 [Exophiala xenobiotica]|uniref:Uncharacterized protein n=1 Tax=Exophiala xenobiotica TaxID=348802 RepID=A0A0D2BNA8_9EURO|nr:uncharacterized protein PV05_06432 [Exophiala xenobiotica]KIW54041.1 hypothetical protein PV05_06432 [Exophiala xenobiotica]